ncbi:MAG: efflux RND transporter permease subunit [Bacteroidetes bacterium]|nr:efflux RND transporter permease subunit [Bacteroidota bacterium]
MIEEHGLLNSVIRFSLRFRGIIIALSILFVGYGIYTLTQAKFGVFPEFAPPQAVIQTEAPGLSPEQVEVLVTQPIENAVNGIVGISSLRSKSIQGISVVTAIFKEGSNIYIDRQFVTERLSTLAGQLPVGVKQPEMTPLVPSTGLTLVIGLTSPEKTPMQLRTFADWVLRRRLLSVTGVANVTVFGGDVKQFQIQVHPDELIKYNLSIEEVLSAAKRATAVEGSGFIENNNQRIVLQTEGQSLTVADIAKTVIIHKNNLNITLADVADVLIAPEPPIGSATIEGSPGVMMMIYGQYGTNTLEVTKNVEAALNDMQPAFNSENINLIKLFRPADFIHTALGNIEGSLILGAVLVVLVLLLFLFNFRTAAISCTAIPLSLLAGIVALQSFGLTLNTMTLGGLAIAIGEVVDDAVIDVENILRRLKENRAQGNHKSIFRVVLEASLEVRTAVIYATFAVVLVFIPILTLSGVAGKLFSPLGIAYIFSVLASLLVALTVTPALSLVLLGNQKIVERKESPFVHWLKERYKIILNKVEINSGKVITAVIIITLAGFTALPFFGESFIPALKEGHFIAHVSAAPGTSINESLELSKKISAALMKLPFIQTIGERTGRAEKGDDTWGTNYSEFEIQLKPLNSEQMVKAQDEIRETLTSFVGVNIGVNTFLTERMEETLSGYTSSVVLNIYGNDLNSLDNLAQETSHILSKVPGAVDVQIQSPPGMPQLTIHLRKDDLQRWGFDAKDVLDAVQTAYQGTDVGQVYDGNQVFTVSTILTPKDRNSVNNVSNLLLKNSDGVYVKLSQLADVYEASGRYIILHNGARRVQTITCNVKGTDVVSFVREAKGKIESSIKFPGGTYIEFGGTAAAQANSRRELFIYSAIAGAGIILLLFIALKNLRNLFLVLSNLPFAFVGGIISILLSGGQMSLGSMVGFITLFGITMRNSLMLISHYEHLVKFEGREWNFETAILGASERLVPILMTALVTGLGLLPLAIGSGSAGKEIEGPLAIVILGGLATSTLLNLLVLPTLSLRFGRFTKNSIDEEIQ